MIELKCQSCFDYLKTVGDNTIDLVLIDPPYQISRDTNFAKGKETGTNVDRFRISMNFGNWDKEFEGLSEVITECYRILKPSGTLICFYDLWKITQLKVIIEEANFKQLRFIEWIKTNAVPINSKINYLTNAREIAVTAVKGSKPIFNSEYDNGIYLYPIYHEKDRFHPTQKPLALIEELIEKHSMPNDMVLDCFSGSATTAIACMRKQRNFMGCEISKEYYDKSIERIKSYE